MRWTRVIPLTLLAASPLTVPGLHHEAIAQNELEPVIEPPPERVVSRIKLPDFLRRVMTENQTIQAQLLGTEAARRRALAEKGTFEPELTGSAQRVENRRPNTVEQSRNLGGIPILDEQNDLFDAGVEALAITGAKVRLGYSLNNYRNNLRPFNDPDPTRPGNTNEWQSFAGVTLTQPLLKGGGATVTLANLRLAALSSEEAFQEYRRQCMVTLAQAETAYWNVFFAREQLRFLNESVNLAEALRADAVEKVRVGKGTELEILEADAALALRRTKRTEAAQRLTETSSQLLGYLGLSSNDGLRYEPADQPDAQVMNAIYAEIWKNALELNPDYLIQKKKRDQTLVRFGVAKNQRLPELNLKGSYGYNGLGNGPASSYEDLADGGFPSWTVGVEFRLPIWGGNRGRHELAAANAVVLQAEKQMENVATQIANALNTSVQKLRHSQNTVADYRKMIQFNENLLNNERERLTAGKIEGRRVLEVEAGLFEVKQGYAESLVAVQRAELEIQLAEGSILQRLGLETTPDELKTQTLAYLGTLKLPTRTKPTPTPTPAAVRIETPKAAATPAPAAAAPGAKARWFSSTAATGNAAPWRNLLATAQPTPAPDATRISRPTPPVRKPEPLREKAAAPAVAAKPASPRSGRKATAQGNSTPAPDPIAFGPRPFSRWNSSFSAGPWWGR